MFLFFSMDGNMKKPSFLLNAFKFIKCTAIILTLFSFNIYAQSISLIEFNNYFKSGQYSKALIILGKNNLIQFDLGEKSYLEGLCYAKLQEYDKAISKFEIAIKNENKNSDLDYEYGQALYAANELKKARNAFSASAAKKFNTPASIYYIAHISQILEEFPSAIENYNKIINEETSDNKIKQIAHFQLAETTLLMLRESFKEKKLTQDNLVDSIDKEIIPKLKKASETDPESNIAFEINQRLQEIQIEFQLDPNLLRNGKRVSAKKQSGYFSQKVKYDNNISLTNEENNISQTRKDSLIFESELYGKYDLVFKKMIVISPEVRLNFVQHSNQTSIDVYQNDAYSLNANLKNRLEHFFYAKPASFLLDLEFSKMYKDWNQVRSRDFYANSKNIGIGESFSYFNIGDTSIKFKYKQFAAANQLISNNTTSISGDQTLSLPNQHLLIALFETDFIDNFNNKTSNSTTYLLRFDYLIPEFLPTYTLGLAMATTMTDTKEQKSTRGTELMLNPSLDLTKDINSKMKISFNYEFTKNSSKLSDYDYKKHVLSTEFKFSF